MSHKTAATVAHTIGIDTGKNTLHLIGLDDHDWQPCIEYGAKALMALASDYLARAAKLHRHTAD